MRGRTDPELKSIISIADTDHDGRVSAAEFIQLAETIHMVRNDTAFCLVFPMHLLPRHRLLPCLSNASIAKTLPLPCVFTAFVAVRKPLRVCARVCVSDDGAIEFAWRVLALCAVGTQVWRVCMRARVHVCCRRLEPTGQLSDAAA